MIAYWISWNTDILHAINFEDKDNLNVVQIVHHGGFKAALF